MSNRRKRKAPYPERVPALLVPGLPFLAPGLHVLEIRHDDNCPTLCTGRMDDCTCTTVHLVVRSPSVRQN